MDQIATPRPSPLILVVDSDASARDTLHRLLRQEGYQVEIAANADMARVLFTQFHPDVVLLDLQLCDADAYAVCAELLSQPAAERSRVIVSSSSDDRESVDHAFECGAIDYIVKPVNWPLLRQRVRQTLLARSVEESLAESEEYFRTVFEHSPDAILLIDPHNPVVAWPIVECNQAACQMDGYTHDELMGQSVDILHESEMSALDRTTYLERLRREGISKLETVHRRKDGATFPIHVSTSLIVLGGEELILEISRDVTEAKRAERALQEERNLLRTLIDNLPDSIFIQDRQGHFVLSNLAHARAAHLLSPDQLVGKTAFDLFSEEAALQHRLDEQAVLQTSQPLVNMERLTLDLQGNDRWSLTTIVPLHDNDSKIIGLVGISRDVTERKQRQQELEAIAAMATALRDASSRVAMLPIILDQLLSLLRAKAAALDTYDPTTNEAIVELARGSWTDLTGLRLPLGAGSAEIAINHVRHNGRSHGDPRFARFARHASAISSVPLIAAGQTLGTLWVGRATHLNDSEERILVVIGDIAANALYRVSLMETLEQRVAKRTAELATANEQLQELDRLKSKFVSDVSHELRTPIANLTLGLHLLERDKPEKQAEHIASLKKYTSRLGSLVDAILDLSRLDARGGEVLHTALDLNSIIDQVLTSYLVQAEIKGLRLTFNPDPDLPPIHGAEYQLAQVLTNLLSNAINYTPRGQVTVSTSIDARRGQACLLVQDTGMGISSEDLPHLFERFYRGQQVGSSNIPGTGLGLSIVKEIVDLHGGEIKVESRPGEGTTFRVWLPIAGYYNTVSLSERRLH
jgi:PAS domain S-box-containing protein